MKLEPEEFIRRLVEHVPPARFHGVRAYGLLAPGARRKLNAVREQLGQLPYDPDEHEETWAETVERITHENPDYCPVCGKRLIRRKIAPKAQSPPGRKGTS